MNQVCQNKKCNKEFDSSVIAEIDPSPDIDYCSNTCCIAGTKQKRLARDKRKSLHVKPNTYQLFLDAKKKITIDPFRNLDEKDSDDKILSSIIYSFLRDWGQ